MPQNAVKSWIIAHTFCSPPETFLIDCSAALHHIGLFLGLPWRSYQFVVSTPFGVHPSVHRPSPPGEYACPIFPSRTEIGRSSGVDIQISLPPCLRGGRGRFPGSYTKNRQSCVGVLFHRLQAQCNPPKVYCGHRVTPQITEYLTIIWRHKSTAPGQTMSKPPVKALRKRPGCLGQPASYHFIEGR